MVDVHFYQQFRGFAIAGEDIEFGEIDTQELSVSMGIGLLAKLKYVRKSLKITIRGSSRFQLNAFSSEARNNRAKVIAGLTKGEDIAIGGDVIKNAVLVKAIGLNQLTTISGSEIIDIQLEYQSLVFSS